MTRLVSLREEILRKTEGTPDKDGAYLWAADLLQNAPLAPLPSFRLAVLRSFTIEPLIEVLKVKFFLEGFRLELFVSEFNQYEQEILSDESRLYRFKPQAIFLAVRLEEMVPRVFTEYAQLSGDEIRAIRSEVVQRVSGWLEQIGRCSSPGSVLLSNFMVPAIGSQGHYDTQTAAGQISVVRALNADLVGLKERFSHVTLFDLDLLASRIGKEQFCDPLQMYRMSNPYRLQAYALYGEHLLSHLRALQGHRRKCLVLDLDNTLWGGTIGEDGMSGVLLSDTYPGNCFKDFQRAVLQLSHRGILLAINSKNDPGEALELFRSHPDMVLKEKDFSSIRINWRDKADNLRDIAEELNVGLDALVFVDDSPAECERIRQACPEVRVVQLPAQKHLYRTAIENLGCFEQLTLTEEDRNRGRMYQAQAQRQGLASRCGTLEDFYASIRMRGLLHRNNRSHIPRIAQMTQKTNQFNLTARRCTEGEISQEMDRSWVYSLEIEDRFGDNGIVAAAVVTPDPGGREWVIGHFLMSCRVVMRTIEETLLAEISEDARSSGAERLVGRYAPSGKNQMVKEFYPQRNFSNRPTDLSGCAEYVFDLTGKERLKPSPWIQLTREAPIHR